MGELSAEESRIYDRQIRLWGVETQQRLNAARIGIIGLTNINMEAAKCLVLAGIKIMLIEDAGVRHDNLEKHDKFNFFASRHEGEDLLSACGRNLAELNPLTSVTTASQLTDAAIATMTDIQVAAEVCPWNELLRLNHITRSHNKGFFVTLSLGDRGGFFSDFGPSHRTVSNHEGRPSRQFCVQFPSLQEVAALNPAELPSGYTRKKALPDIRLTLFLTLLSHVHASSDERRKAVQVAVKRAGHDTDSEEWALLPGHPNALVGAVVGGQISQEIQRKIGGKDCEDFKNVAVFDGFVDMGGRVFNVNVRKHTLE